MEVLHVEWWGDSHGSMDIHLDSFFPSTIKKAKQLLKLIRTWCDDETIKSLREYFTRKIREIDVQIDKIKQVYPNTRVGSKEKKRCETDFKRLQRLKNKYVKYLAFLNEGRC